MDSAALFKQLLETAGVNVNGWGLFVSKEPDPAPHRAITCFNTGGLQPSPKWSLDFPSVQIRVRGFPNGYQESRAKAEECKTALLGIDPQDVNGGIDRLVSVIIRTDIADIGFDQTNRPIHTINFNLITQPKADGYRIAIPPIAATTFTPPTVQYPLDVVPGAAAAYSTRRLASGLAGNFGVNNIKRASDGQNIGVGLSGDDYDTAAADTFLGGSQGTVIVWSDQTPNSNNLAKLLAPNQPAFNKIGGIYRTVWGAGTDQSLKATSKPSISGIFYGGGFAMFVVDVENVGSGNSLLSNNSYNLFLYSGPGIWFIQKGAGGDGSWGTGNISGLTGLHIIDVQYDSTSSASQPVFSVDGVVIPLSTVNGYSGTPTDDSTSQLEIGNSTIMGNSWGFGGGIFEALVYPMIPTSSDISALRANAKAYWNTP